MDMLHIVRSSIFFKIQWLSSFYGNHENQSINDSDLPELYGKQERQKRVVAPYFEAVLKAVHPYINKGPPIKRIKIFFHKNESKLK